MEMFGGRWKKMEGHCSTGHSPHWAVVPMEEEEGEEEEEEEAISVMYYECVCVCVCARARVFLL